MLTNKPVLVIEDNVYLALDLSAEIEGMNGRVIGPVGNVSAAWSLLDREEVGAAVLGSDPPNCDILPVARALIKKNVLFVIHADQHMPSSLTEPRPGILVLIKPVRPRDIISILPHEVMRLDVEAS